MRRRAAGLLAKSVVFLLAMWAGAQTIAPTNAQPPGPIVSGWMTQPATLDGRITTAMEWSDTIPVDLTLRNTLQKEVSGRVWVKNDLKWFCVIIRVKWPADDIDRQDSGEFSIYSGPSGLSGTTCDTMGVRFDGQTIDWCSIVRVSSPWENLAETNNNVEGSASYDGTHYWFEFRRELNTGDRYDLALVPGQTYANANFNMRDASAVSEQRNYGTSIILRLAPVLPSIEIVRPLHEAITSFFQVNFTASVSGHLNKVTLVVQKEHDMKFNEKTGLYEASLTLAEGMYEWSVKVLGVLGNVTSIPERRLTVDTTKPVVTIRSPASGEVIRRNDVYVIWDASDATSGIAKVEVKVDASDWIDVTGKSSHTASFLVEGNHEVRMRATDKAGNVAEKSTTFSSLPPPWYMTYWYVPVTLAAVIVAIAAVVKSRRTPSRLVMRPPEAKLPKIEPPTKPPTRQELLKELEELHRSGRITETAYKRLKKKYENRGN